MQSLRCERFSAAKHNQLERFEGAVRWSQMNGQQRKYLTTRARFKDIVVRGKVIAREPLNVWAEAIVTAKALDRDERTIAKLTAGAACDAAVAAFTTQELSALATRCEPGRAYGSRELTRARAGAMPMGYFKGTNYAAG